MSRREGSGEDPATTAAGGSTTERGTARSLSTLIDAKSLLHVQPFDRDRTTFLGWTWSFAMAVRALNRNMYDEFRRVDGIVTQGKNRSRFSSEQKENLEATVHASRVARYGGGSSHCQIN